MSSFLGPFYRPGAERAAAGGRKPGEPILGTCSDVLWLGSVISLGFPQGNPFTLMGASGVTLPSHPEAAN